ncbi:hypothetical protein CWI38_1474p0020 [Hamiltosporidium tvaerminnensis]|uniref:Uncharacterized protein n=1 Tax=Hamiltosporidium tvaerminnensis TaxID=1176355 RepID=A0A4Q9LRA0_9MICR|nr:hypothetical protein CWI38_1474p0020 [Hamiltosporidium tvaerminnensis]
MDLDDSSYNIAMTNRISEFTRKNLKISQAEITQKLEALFNYNDNDQTIRNPQIKEILLGLMHVMRISSDPGTVTSSCMHPMENKKSYTTENMNGCYGKGSEMFNIISER